MMAHEAFVCEPGCPVCDGIGTVCEAHPGLPWGGLLSGAPIEGVRGCWCGGAGMPCPMATLRQKREENERLHDLVRHQRGPLYDAGLLTDEEYAALAADHAAVARLEGYDAMRAELTEARALLRRVSRAWAELTDINLGYFVSLAEHAAAHAAIKDALGKGGPS